jgi:hypothetical protein
VAEILIDNYSEVKYFNENSKESSAGAVNAVQVETEYTDTVNDKFRAGRKPRVGPELVKDQWSDLI